MADERKPVICPGCGEQMSAVYKREKPSSEEGEGFSARFYCKCGWCSPERWGLSCEKAFGSAYEAATRRPENRPLTRDQAIAMDPYDAVWMISVNTAPIPMRSVRSAEWVQRQLTDRSGGEWMARKLLFAAKPTPADIEAARKERP